MTKDAPNEWDTTASNNTDVGGINIAEGCPASNVNNALRAIMAQVAAQFGVLNVKGADIASATTTDLSTATGNAVDITGTTTITGLGTVAAGQVFILQFDGALTLTHNGTSLKLPGAANITTAAGDIAVMISEGSGNWRCAAYQINARAPSGTAIQYATASGTTAMDFTIPGWANCIDLSMASMSHSDGSGRLTMVQIGDSGGIENTGYSTAVGFIGSGSSVDNSIDYCFPVSVGVGASAVINGIMRLRRNSLDGTKWVATGETGWSGGLFNNVTGGVKTLSAALTTVRVQISGGTGFDSGTVSCVYW